MIDLDLQFFFKSIVAAPYREEYPLGFLKYYKKINYETGEVDLTGTRIIQDANEENDSRVGAADHGGKTTNTKFGGNKRKKTRKKYLTKKKSRKRRSRRRRRRRHTAKKKKV